MKLLRKLLAPVLAALIAAPAPVVAQTIRVTLQAPLTGAPAISGPSLTAFGGGTSSPYGSVAPLSASLLVLPSPAIAPAPIAPVAPVALIPSIKPAAAAPVSVQPRAEALIAAMRPAPSTPDAPVEERKAIADAQFDGAASKTTTEPYGEGVSLPDAVGKGPRLEVPGLDHKTSKLGRVPAPRPWVEKGKVLLAYGGLTASAVALHAPFDRIAPLVIALVLAAPMAMVAMMFMVAGQSVAPAAPGVNEEAKALAQTEALKPSAEMMALLERLAAEAKVPMPARVNVIAGEKVQAMVGGGDEHNPGYEIRYTKALEALRPEAQEAIMRHEFAHRRHHDGGWGVVTMILTTTPMMVALLGVTDKPDYMGWIAGAIAATSVLLFPASQQHSEYLADQYAASKPEGSGPLARFFIEDSENPVRAASALSGREFSSETGWKRRAIMFWDSLKTLFSAHPSHDRRIARLARLAAKEKKD